jgi:hypothetical protein
LDQKKFDQFSNLNSILFEQLLTRWMRFKPGTMAMGPTCRCPTFLTYLAPASWCCPLPRRCRPPGPTHSSARCQAPHPRSLSALWCHMKLDPTTAPHCRVPIKSIGHRRPWVSPSCPIPSPAELRSAPSLPPLTPCPSRIAKGTSVPRGSKPNATT